VWIPIAGRSNSLPARWTLNMAKRDANLASYEMWDFDPTSGSCTADTY
jgi:hypothetical protein